MFIPLKTLTAIAVTILAVLGFIFGSFLPVSKSHSFTETYARLGNVKSLEEFNAILDPVLSKYSPVGQDEITGSYLGIVVNLLSQDNAPPKELIGVLIKRAETAMEPVLEKQAGFLYSQNLYKLGLIYYLATVRRIDTGYYDKAEDILMRGLEASPGRPVFTDTLFRLYVWKGDKENAIELGKRILESWPDNKDVRQTVESLESGKK